MPPTTPTVTHTLSVVSSTTLPAVGHCTCGWSTQGRGSHEAARRELLDHVFVASLTSEQLAAYTAGEPTICVLRDAIVLGTREALERHARGWYTEAPREPVVPAVVVSGCGAVSGPVAACEAALRELGFERCDDSRAYLSDLEIADAACCSACGGTCAARVYATFPGRGHRLLVVCATCGYAEEL